MSILQQPLSTLPKIPKSLSARLWDVTSAKEEKLKKNTNK